MNLLNMMINNMTDYCHIPAMTVTQSVKVEKNSEQLTWENDGQVYYTDTVIIRGGSSQCHVINGVYAAELSVSSPGMISLTGLVIPPNSHLVLKTDQSIMLANCMIQGTIECVGGNPGVIVDFTTLCQSNLKSVPVLSLVSQPLMFPTSETVQKIQLPSGPANARLLYGFYQPTNEVTPIITLSWNSYDNDKKTLVKGWMVGSYDTTLLKSCTLTDPHMLELTWAATSGATQLNHHFL